MSLILTIWNRIKNPIVVGEVEKVSVTQNPETVLLSMRDYKITPEGRRTPKKAALVAFPADDARRMSMRETFLMVCLPVAIRKDPEQRSGLVAMPLPTDMVLFPKAA